jgi:hypothetical protein
MNADGVLVECAKRVGWQRSEVIAIPVAELSEWRAKFGPFMLETLTGNSVSVRIADLGACKWGSLKCNCTIDSSTPDAVGPRRHDEHRASNRVVWGLFADDTLVYKSVRVKDRVETVQSWYGHGAYDPMSPGITDQERARAQYDPEFPEIELL